MVSIIKEFSGFIKVNTDRMHLRKALLKAAVIVVNDLLVCPDFCYQKCP